jgi:hypothetical protein
MEWHATEIRRTETFRNKNSRNKLDEDVAAVKGYTHIYKSRLYLLARIQDLQRKN